MGSGSRATLSTRRLLSRRALRQTGLLAAMSGVLIAVSAVAVVLPAMAERGMRDGGATLLAEHPADARAVRVTTGAEGSAADDGKSTEVLASLFAPGTVDVDASSRTSEVPVLAGSPGATRAGLSVLLGSEAGLSGVRVVSGSWPAVGAAPSPGSSSGTVVPVAVQSDAARTLGVTVGDRVVVGSAAANVSLRVAALWRADDPLAGRWFGESLVGSGRDSTEVGPLLTAPGDLHRLDGVADVHRSWTVTARPAAVSPERLDGVRSGLSRVAEALPGRHLTPSDDTQVDGSLRSTVDAVAAADGVTRALVAVAIALVAGAGIVSVVQLAGLLVAARRPEVDLLRARGAVSKQLVVAAMVELVSLAVPSGVVGLAIGVVAARVLDPKRSWAVGGEAAGLGFTLLAVVGGAALLVAWVEWRAARTGRAGLAGGGARSPGTLPLVILTVLALLAASFGVWRLSRSGLSATDIDPAAAMSPVLLVVTGALVTAVAFGLIGGGLARALAGGRSAGPVLVARQLSRRRAAFAAAVLALALVTATAGFATSVAATSSAVDAAAARITLGSGARITGSGDLVAQAGTQVVTAAPVEALRGVDDAVTVLDDTAGVGQQTVALRALSAHRVVGLLGSDADTRAIAKGLRPGEPAGVGLPAGSRSLSARVTAGAAVPDITGGAVSLVAWLSDSDGAVAAIPLRTPAGGGSLTAGDPVALGSTQTVSASLPAAAGRWRLLALEPSLQVEVPDGVSVRSALSVTGVEGGVSMSALQPVSGAISPTLDSDRAAGRVPIGAKAQSDRPAVVVTRSLADSLGVAPGGRLDLTLASTGSVVSARVSSIVTTVPGSGSADAVALDLPTLVQSAVDAGQAVPRPDDVWVRQKLGAPSLADQVATTLTYTAQTTTAESTSAAPIVDSAVSALIVATIAGTLLALVVFVAFAIGLARARREEGAILRAVGISPGRHGRLRFAELVSSVIAALVGGAVTGVVTAGLTAAHFGIAASPGASSLFVVDATFAEAPWALLAAGVAVPAVVVAVVAAARAARRAVATSVRGDDR